METCDSLSYVYHNGNSDLVNRTIGEQLKISCHEFGDREAIVSCYEGKKFTFKEVLKKVDQLAIALLKLGLKQGDRIGIWAPNSCNWYISMLATVRIGCIAVAINPAYQAPEIKYCIDKVGIRAIITIEKFRSQNYYNILCEILPHLRSNSKKNGISSDWSTSVEFIILDSPNRFSGVFNFDDFLLENTTVENISDLQKTINYNSCCNIQFTSGTTGKPKAVMLSHQAFINNGMHLGFRQGFHLKHHKICMQVPFFHSYGLVAGLMSALFYGATIVIPNPVFKAEESLKAILSENCSSIYGVPTMYIDLIEKVKEGFLENEIDLEVAVIAGSMCTSQLLKDIKKYLGVQKLSSQLGMTETTGGIFQSKLEDSDEFILKYVGFCQDHIEAKVLDLNENLVPFGTPGQLCVRGYCTMLGYYDDKEKTKDVLDSNGWLKTGDQFVLYPNGYGQIIGRINEIIIRGGENIYPKEIEEFLNQHPDIVESHIIGVSDRRLGEEIAAFIRLATPKVSMTRDEIKQFCHGKIAHFKIPKHIIVMKSFPKTSSGKIQKFKLLEMFKLNYSCY